MRFWRRTVSQANHHQHTSADRTQPWGLKWRSSVWFITTVVGLGLSTDLLVYSLIVPVIPFQLENMGYSGISGLSGWLLFAYSGGIVIFTPPVAHLSEKYRNRQLPLFCGLAALTGTQLMFLFAPAYWLMVLARLLQGLSSSVVWVAGLALLCDTVPESSIGRQLGLAMSGLSIGFLVGPPVSGALYERFGFHGPFVFGLIITLIDLIGRILIIERKHAILWGVDPAAPADEGASVSEVDVEKGKDSEKDNVGMSYAAKIDTATMENDIVVSPNHVQLLDQTPLAGRSTDVDTAVPESSNSGRRNHALVPALEMTVPPRLSMLGVVAKVLKSTRAEAAFVCTLIYGSVLTSQEPALPLHLQDVWHFNPSKVGLVYIAAVVPTLFSSTITGYVVDKLDTGLITVVSLMFSLPWLLILIIQSSLPLFIIAFALANFGVSGTVSPLTTELAVVTRKLDGVGYAHVYGAFNLAYGIGSALGPIIGGQLYDHVWRGWMAICLFGAGSAVLAISLAIAFFGDDPLLAQIRRRFERDLRCGAAGQSIYSS